MLEMYVPCVGIYINVLFEPINLAVHVFFFVQSPELCLLWLSNYVKWHILLASKASPDKMLGLQ